MLEKIAFQCFVEVENVFKCWNSINFQEFFKNYQKYYFKSVVQYLGDDAFANYLKTAQIFGQSEIHKELKTLTL